MEPTASEINQFQKLYILKFGIELDDKTARNKLLLLVRQMYAVYKPITQQQFQAYKAKNEYINEDKNNEQSRTASDS